MHTGKYSYCSINRSIQSHPGDVTVGGGVPLSLMQCFGAVRNPVYTAQSC